MYGLPHAGKIAQDVLIGRLATTHGYLQTGTKCLFRHATNGVAFALVVDDFAVVFKDLASADHLIACLELYYKLTLKKNATKHLGLTIEVDKVVHEVRISNPDVIAKALKQFPPNSTAVAGSPAIYQPPNLERKHRRHLLQIPRLFLPLKNIIAYNKLVECYRFHRLTCSNSYRICSLISHASQITQQQAAERLLSYFRNYPPGYYPIILTFLY